MECFTKLSTQKYTFEELNSPIYFVIHKRQFRYPPELSNLVFIKILWRLQNPPFSSCSIDPQLNEEKHKNLTMIMLLLLNLWLTSSGYSLWYFPLIIYLSLNIINLCIFSLYIETAKKLYVVHAWNQLYKCSKICSCIF